MTDLKAALEPLLKATRQRYIVCEGLQVTFYPTNVVLHIDRREGSLQRADVDAVRAAFAELGYVETDSWVATQGASWLSEGVATGVSFRIAVRS